MGGDVSKSTSNLMILLSPIISCTSEWLYCAVLLLLCGVVYCLRCDACFRLIVLDTDVVRRRHFAVWAAATSPIPLYLPQSFCFLSATHCLINSLPKHTICALYLYFVVDFVVCGFIGSPLIYVYFDALCFFVPFLSVVYCSSTLRTDYVLL